jgi:hypothetical protein
MESKITATGKLQERKSRAKKTFKTLKKPLTSNPGSSVPQQVSPSSVHTKLFCSSSFQNFSNKQNMCTTREHQIKDPSNTGMFDNSETERNE